MQKWKNNQKTDPINKREKFHNLVSKKLIGPDKILAQIYLPKYLQKIGSKFFWEFSQIFKRVKLFCDFYSKFKIYSTIILQDPLGPFLQQIPHPSTQTISDWISAKILRI